MGESLMQQRRVIDEVFRNVKICRKGRNVSDINTICYWRYLTRKHRLTSCQQPR